MQLATASTSGSSKLFPSGGYWTTQLAPMASPSACGGLALSSRDWLPRRVHMIGFTLFHPCSPLSLPADDKLSDFAAVTVQDTQVLVMGGLLNDDTSTTPSSVSSAVMLYDALEGTWTTKSSMPVKVYRAAAAYDPTGKKARGGGG